MSNQGKKEQFVEVYRASGEMEAQVIRGLLGSYGIPSFLKSEAAPSVHAFAIDGLGEMRIMVAADRATEAKRILEDRSNV